MKVVQSCTEQHKYHCANPACGKLFARKPGGRQTCGEACKKALQRAVKTSKTKASRLELWSQTHLGKWIISKIREIGTVQILTGHTVDSLNSLMTIHSRLRKCYGYDKEQRKSLYHICHIQPARGRDGNLGLLHPDNLFIGEASRNRVQSNTPPQHAGVGLSIPSEARDPRWNVEPGMSALQIAKLIKSFLGPVFDDYLAQAGSLKRAEAEALALRIDNKQHNGKAVQPLDSLYTQEQLLGLPIDELRQMDAFQRGKEVSTYRPDLHTRAALCVYREELERLGLGDSLIPLVDVVLVYLGQYELFNDTGLHYRQYTDFYRVKGYVAWQPFKLVDAQKPWGPPRTKLVHAQLVDNVCRACYDTLQGNQPNIAALAGHLYKRLQLNDMLPNFPTGQRANGLHTQFGTLIPDLIRLMVDSGLFTLTEVMPAVIPFLTSFPVEPGLPGNRLAA